MVLLLFACYWIIAQSQGPLLSMYSQTITSRYTFQGLPELADWTSLPVSNAQSFSSSVDGSFYFLANGKLMKYSGNTFSDETKLYPGIGVGNHSKLVVFSHTAGVAAVTADDSTISVCLVTHQSCKRAATKFGKVNGLVYDKTNDRIVIATKNGLFIYRASSGAQESHHDFGNVISVTAAADGTIAAGTSLLMWRTLAPGDLNSFHFFRVGGLIDGAPKGLAFDILGYLWIVNDICVNIQAPDFTFRRVAGNEGLPVANLTRVTVDTSNNDVWIGSTRGLVRFEQTAQKWHYFYGLLFCSAD